MSVRRAVACAAGLLAAVISGAAAPADAHPLAPALLSLEASTDGRVAVVWKVSRLRPTGSDVRPVLPARCRAVGGPVFTQGPNDVTESWSVDCGARGLVGATLAVSGLDTSRTDALVRVQLADGRAIRGLVSPDRPEFVVPERESTLEVFASYLRLGVEHLVFGLDHVLFVLGLVLLVSGWRRLVATITAFTLGHSVTLSLATLGIVRVPTRLFEFAIAFSILVVGAELARGQMPGAPVSALRRRPWAMSFSFGLLHGLGFAAALSQVGLPDGEIPLSLLAFNGGVEIGQLAVVAPLLALRVWMGERTARLPLWLRRVPAYVIGSLAGFWCIERAVFIL